MDFNFLFNPFRFLFQPFCCRWLAIVWRSSSFLDRNAVKVKSGFDVVADVFCTQCTPLGEPFSLSTLKLIIFPHLWRNIAPVAHFSPQNEQNIIAKSRTCKSSFPAKNGWNEGCRPGHMAQPWFSSVTLCAQDFSFLICIDTFSFWFNAISICSKVFSDFNAALFICSMLQIQWNFNYERWHFQHFFWQWICYEASNF